jgi:hypothetical protein
LRAAFCHERKSAGSARHEPKRGHIAAGQHFQEGSAVVKILQNQNRTLPPFAVNLPNQLASLGCLAKDSKQEPEG